MQLFYTCLILLLLATFKCLLLVSLYTMNCVYWKHLTNAIVIIGFTLRAVIEVDFLVIVYDCVPVPGSFHIVA
jgi:hypothetical protein